MAVIKTHSPVSDMPAQPLEVDVASASLRSKKPVKPWPCYNGPFVMYHIKILKNI